MTLEKETQRAIAKTNSCTFNESFDNKYIIVGEIIFYGDRAVIQSIDKSIVAISQDEVDEYIKYSEDNCLDYVIPQDVAFPVYLNEDDDYNVYEHLVRLAYDRGWM